MPASLKAPSEIVSDPNAGCAHTGADFALAMAAEQAESSVVQGLSIPTIEALVTLQSINPSPYYHWNSRGDWARAPYTTCSPSLTQLNHYLGQTYGGHTLGCHNDRPISGSSAMSSHAWGAALDFLPTGGNADGVNRIAPFLIEHSAELGINTIHDYVRQRMWKPGGVGWVPAHIGSVGGQWLHIETTVAAWGDGRSVQEKLGAGPPPPVIPPAPIVWDPLHHHYGLFPLNTGKPDLWYGTGYTNGTQSLQPFCQYANLALIVERGAVIPGVADYKVCLLQTIAWSQIVCREAGLPVIDHIDHASWSAIDKLASRGA